MMLLYHHPKNKRAAPETVSSTMLKHTTGVDLDTLWGMTFPDLTAMAHCERDRLLTSVEADDKVPQVSWPMSFQAPSVEL